MITSTDTRRPRLRTQNQLWEGLNLFQSLQHRAKYVALSGMGAFVSPPLEKEYILFLFYHWVLDDEQRAFRGQLQFLREHGDFIGLDDAVRALQSPSGIGGRYFCVTFDDGFKNWHTNAAPVLSDLRVPAAFFLPTKYIGLDLDKDWDRIAPFYRRSWSGLGRYFEFLNWNECREISAAGFTIGSHTHTHPRLVDLSMAEAEEEMRVSKSILEDRLGRSCDHFCCPWGKVGKDFDPIRHGQLARKVGYKSFLTTEDGLNLKGTSPFHIRRTATEPYTGLLWMRYGLFPSVFKSLRAKLRKREPLGSVAGRRDWW